MNIYNCMNIYNAFYINIYLYCCSCQSYLRCSIPSRSMHEDWKQLACTKLGKKKNAYQHLYLLLCIFLVPLHFRFKMFTVFLHQASGLF